MKTFVLAGHETSASMLNWSLFELLENSDLMDKVRIALWGEYLHVLSASEYSELFVESSSARKAFSAHHHLQ